MTPTPPPTHDLREAVARETRWPILKAMAANYHDGHRWDHLDATACAEGANEIRTLRSELARLTGDLKAAEDQNEALHVKLAALAPHGSCACSYDKPDDVCSHHSPALSAALADVARRTGERDEAREAIALCNNSFGSYSYHLKPHPAEQIEKIKAQARSEWARANAAEAELATLKAAAKPC